MIRFLVRSLAAVVLALAVLALGEAGLSAGTAGLGADNTPTSGDCPICAEPEAVERCIPVYCPAAAVFTLIVLVPRRDDTAPALAHQRREQGIEITLDPPPPKPS